MSHREQSVVPVPWKIPWVFVMPCAGIPRVSAPSCMFWKRSAYWRRLFCKLWWSWLHLGLSLVRFPKVWTAWVATNSASSVKSSCNPQPEISRSPYRCKHICIPVCLCFLVLFFLFPDRNLTINKFHLFFDVFQLPSQNKNVLNAKSWTKS